MQVLTDSAIVHLFRFARSLQKDPNEGSEKVCRPRKALCRKDRSSRTHHWSHETS